MKRKPPNASAKKEGNVPRKAIMFNDSLQTDDRKLLQCVLSLSMRHIRISRGGRRSTKVLQSSLIYERGLLRLLILLLLRLALVQDAERQPIELPLAALCIQRPDGALLVDPVRHVLLDLVGDRLAPLVELPELEILPPSGAPDRIEGL